VTQPTDATAALEEASELALDYDSSVRTRNRSEWRDGEPTARQVEYAVSLGLEPAGLRKLELADAIT